MFFLSPAKLLVVLVIVMIVVGPDRLPHLARQIGAALQSLRQLHAKVEGDLRESMPNLPSSKEIAHYTRKPTALLSKLMDLDGDQAADEDGDEHLVADPGAEEVIDTGPPLPGADWPTDHAAPGPGAGGAGQTNGHTSPAPAPATTTTTTNGVAASEPAPSPVPEATVNGTRRPVPSTADGTPYSDPNMN